MGMNTNQEILEQARRKHEERSERLVEHFLNAMGPLDNAGEVDERAPASLAAVLFELGAVWREEADSIEQAGKRGWKTLSEQIRDAATRVISVAQGLEKYGTGGPARAIAGPNKTDVTTEFLDSVGHCGVREPISGAICTKPKHDSTTSHHGSGITWPWENEPEPIAVMDPAEAEMIAGHFGVTVAELGVPLAPAEVLAILMPEADQPSGEVMALSTSGRIIGAADAPPPWAAEPVLDVIALNAPYTQPWPEHLSVSSITELTGGCALKWRLGRLHGAPRRPSWANVGGSAVHACIKYLETTPGALEQMTTPEGMHSLFSTALGHEIASTEAANPEFPISTWSVANGGKETREFWEHDGPEMVHRYLEWRAKWTAQGWELLQVPGRGPAVELEVLFAVPGTQVPLKGFIDSAWRHRTTGDVAIIDPKSGKSVPNDHFQLSTYGAALESLRVLVTGRILGSYWSARTGQLSGLVDLADRCPADELAYRVNTATAQLRAQAFAPNPNANYGGCGSCELRLSCPVGSRRNLGKVSEPGSDTAA